MQKIRFLHPVFFFPGSRNIVIIRIFFEKLASIDSIDCPSPPPGGEGEGEYKLIVAFSDYFSKYYRSFNKMFHLSLPVTCIIA